MIFEFIQGVKVSIFLSFLYTDNYICDELSEIKISLK
jgi:hypothetical protein